MKGILPPSPLDALPLFASDRAIAEAIVGKKDAGKWLDRLPTLERLPGFPKIDPVHGGRAVPLVRLFYSEYLRLPAEMKGLPDGEEDEASWKKRSRRRV
jgi:hypothetical protein